jgi:hypothetical protein
MTCIHDWSEARASPPIAGATFTGYPTISHWDPDTDTEPLFHDAVKVLCLKAAVGI